MSRLKNTCTRKILEEIYEKVFMKCEKYLYIFIKDMDYLDKEKKDSFLDDWRFLSTIPKVSHGVVICLYIFINLLTLQLDRKLTFKILFEKHF